MTEHPNVTEWWRIYDLSRDDRDPVAFIDYWRERAADVLPTFATDPTVIDSAARMLATATYGQWDGATETAETVIRESNALSNRARLADMEHGEVSPERATYSWVREQVDTFRADGSLVDTVPAHPSAPAAMEGGRHTVRRGRSKRGATAVVTARGVATVIGSWEHDVHGGLTPERLSILAEVMGVRRGAIGANVLDVDRVTARRYVRSGLIPAAIGSDAEGWSDMTPATIGVRTAPDGEVWASADVCDTARQNVRDLYSAAGLDESRDVGPMTYPRRGLGLTRGLPAESIADRWRAAEWLASLRDDRVTSAARIGSECDAVTFAPELGEWRPRRRLTIPRRRKHDVTARTVTLANGYCWVAVSELLAPAADSEHVYRGHVLVARPAASGGQTVRGKRKRTTRAKRTVGATFAAVDRAALLAHFATLAAGERTTWTCGALRGTFTLSPNRRYNLGVKHDRGEVTASRRTLTALDRILARQDWLATVPA
jgi:hypothetical protein